MSENLISAQTPVLSGSREKLAKAIDAQLSAFDTAMASLGQRVEALKKVKANISVMTASQNYEALLDGHEGLDANKAIDRLVSFEIDLQAALGWAKI